MIYSFSLKRMYDNTYLEHKLFGSVLLRILFLPNFSYNLSNISKLVYKRLTLNLRIAYHYRWTFDDVSANRLVIYYQSAVLIGRNGLIISSSNIVFSFLCAKNIIILCKFHKSFFCVWKTLNSNFDVILGFLLLYLVVVKFKLSMKGDE